MTPVRILTFNVCGLPSALPPLADRAREFGQAIEDSDIDVVTLQEVWFRSTFATIRAHLPSFAYVAQRGRPHGPAGGLVTFSRHRLGQIGYRSFGLCRPSAGSSRFRLKRTVNSLLQGVLSAELPGHDLTVVNTHLTANKDGNWSSANRYFDFQAAQLARLQQTSARPSHGRVVVAGDFNLASGSPLYRRFVAEGGWDDPFADSDPATYKLEFLPPGSAAHRIDYLLARGGAVSDPQVWFEQPSGAVAHLSDHVALTARLGLSNYDGDR